MKTRNLFVAASVLAASLAVAANSAQQVQLLRTLVENSTDTYKINLKVAQTLNSPQFGEQPLNITSGLTYKLKTLKVDPAKGSADVQATTIVDSIDAGDSLIGSQLAGKKPVPVVQDGTIDKFGHLSLKDPVNGDLLQSAVMGASGSLQSTLFIALPDHPVQVGDTWDIVIPKSSYTGTTDQKLTAKLTGVQKVDGKDAWTVDLSGTINIVFDSATLPQTASDTSNPFAKAHVIVKGSTMINGTGTIEKATGKTLSLSTTGNTKSKIEIPDQGDITAEVAGTLGTTLKLQG